MKAQARLIHLSFAVVLVVTSLGCAHSIEGTYVLMRRELPDGSVQQPPDLFGLMTYDDGHRNFNIYWTDEQGRPYSISSISKYTLTDEEYTEENVYYMVNDEIGGAGVTYDLSQTSGASPVANTETGLELQLPLHNEPCVVFDDEGFTATAEGKFVDYWAEVEDN
jgi:hypothetical protein